MLKLIAVNYTVMLNGYSQWLNIKGKKLFYRDISSIDISDAGLKKDAIKEILKIYCIYVVCTLYIWRLNVKLYQIKVYLKCLMLRGINHD